LPERVATPGSASARYRARHRKRQDGYRCLERLRQYRARSTAAVEPFMIESATRGDVQFLATVASLGFPSTVQDRALGQVYHASFNPVGPEGWLTMIREIGSRISPIRFLRHIELRAFFEQPVLEHLADIHGHSSRQATTLPPCLMSRFQPCNRHLGQHMTSLGKPVRNGVYFFPGS
jgi:hypothetical protein